MFADLGKAWKGWLYRIGGPDVTSSTAGADARIRRAEKSHMYLMHGRRRAPDQVIQIAGPPCEDLLYLG
eukprot:2897600-Amphidinium_carterae.1